jgi:hypothetical protein
MVLSESHILQSVEKIFPDTLPFYHLLAFLSRTLKEIQNFFNKVNFPLDRFSFLW